MKTEDIRPKGEELAIYIAGKMRGVPQYGFPAFDEAEACLREAGWEVVFSPAAMDREEGLDPEELPDGFDWNGLPEGYKLADMVQRDMCALCQSDAIYLLGNWRDSTGARIERKVARMLGLRIIEGGVL